MRVLVLGGTGQTGPDLVATLTERGHEVTLVNRGQRPGIDGVELIVADREPDHPDGLAPLEGALRAGRTWDAAIDVWPSIPKIVERTARLLEPAVERYAYVSSISAYADPSAQNQDEHAPTLDCPDADEREFAMKIYGQFKGECEKRVRQYFPRERHLVWRPGLIAGRRDQTFRTVYWPTRVRTGGEILAPGDGNDRTQFIDVRDLVEFQVRTLEEHRSGVYNVTGPSDTLTMRAYLEACARVTGASPSYVWAAAPFLEEFEIVMWKDMPCWVAPGAGYDGFTSFAIQKAIDAGLTFRPLEETITDTLAWFDGLSAQDQHEIAQKAGLHTDREREAIEALRAAT